uniref:NADP-dependent oxidoreductase domain-containing protein n=1 Tax=Globisporangium ultimum (strain ATCC 200006 / CBS 805.95 / DAOM BR144) TaxID=431595 RepID=K3XDA2_GLOUD
MATPARLANGMKYRFLGDSGLLVSTLSFGCMTFNDETSEDTAGKPAGCNRARHHYSQGDVRRAALLANGGSD